MKTYLHKTTDKFVNLWYNYSVSIGGKDNDNKGNKTI